jgi:hypothetical protein
MPSTLIPTTEHPAEGTAATRAGTILLIATALELLAMAHHPTVTPHALPGVTVIEQAVQQIPKLAALSGLVHALLMALMLTVVYSLVEFALRRGLTRPAVRAGCIAYAAGVIVMLGAALVSGWVTPGLMILTPHSTPEDLAINGQLLSLCQALNQSCANFGAVAMSAGIVLWSFDLMMEKGARRLIGGAGIFLGAVPALALIFGLLRLNVHGATELLAVQAVWNIMIAIALLRSIV